MIEIPESHVISGQLNQAVAGKTIQSTTTGQSPHKFAWYEGDPSGYAKLLNGNTIKRSEPLGSMIEIHAGKVSLVLSEGAFPLYLKVKTSIPKKHQLLLAFTDQSFLVVSVRMYGGILAFPDGEGANKYYLIAKSKPSPMEATFDEAYFLKLVSQEANKKLSAKAFLATEQRIPGLGNGVIQDILFNAKIHPKQKINSLLDVELETMFFSIKNTLREMVLEGGRDTEKDLFGNAGGYQTKCSRHTLGTPCSNCGTEITKASYLGGSIYFCPNCQTT